MPQNSLIWCAQESESSRSQDISWTFYILLARKLFTLSTDVAHRTQTAKQLFDLKSTADQRPHTIFLLFSFELFHRIFFLAAADVCSSLLSRPSVSVRWCCMCVYVCIVWKWIAVAESLFFSAPFFSLMRISFVWKLFAKIIPSDCTYSYIYIFAH